MKKNIVSAFLMALIVIGIGMSILNFSREAYAAPMAGTVTQETSMYWQLVYYLQGRWLYDNYYCIAEPRDCTIVN